MAKVSIYPMPICTSHCSLCEHPPTPGHINPNVRTHLTSEARHVFIDLLTPIPVGIFVIEHTKFRLETHLMK